MSLLSSFPWSLYNYNIDDPFYTYYLEGQLKQLSSKQNNIIEKTDTHIIYNFNFPGLKKEDLIVELSQNVLYLKGSTKLTGKNMSKVVTYFDSITLPDNLTEEDIECSYENGLLYVKIPKNKSESKQRYRINVM